MKCPGWELDVLYPLPSASKGNIASRGNNSEYEITNLKLNFLKSQSVHWKLFISHDLNGVLMDNKTHNVNGFPEMFERVTETV